MSAPGIRDGATRPPPAATLLPPPAVEPMKPQVCSVDTLNVLINDLVRMRDALVGIENIETVCPQPTPDDVTKGARRRVEQRVHDLARKLTEWSGIG